MMVLLAMYPAFRLAQSRMPGQDCWRKPLQICKVQMDSRGEGGVGLIATMEDVGDSGKLQYTARVWRGLWSLASDFYPCQSGVNRTGRLGLLAEHERGKARVSTA